MTRQLKIVSPLVAALLLTCATIAVRAADTDAAGADAASGAATADYRAARANWDELNKRLDDLEKQFAAAPASQKAAIREQYGELVGRIEKLMPELRTKAIAAYREQPNGDAPLIRLLIGMAANDNRKDRYADAAEVTGLLLANDRHEAAVLEQAAIAAYSSDDFVEAKKLFEQARQTGELSALAEDHADDVDAAIELWSAEQAIREAEAKADDLPRVRLATTQGEITLELFENEAPQTVGNFVSLVESGYYDGVPFHRVLPNFMAQSGDPTGTGSGDPGYSIYCECYEPDHRKHFSGSLSMAKGRQRDTGGSQFFLTFRRTAHLDGAHTVFGRIIDGYQVLAKLRRVDPAAFRPQGEPDKIVKAEVLRKRDHVYEPTKVE